MKNIFKYNVKYFFNAIVFIAAQACITLAMAENGDVNSKIFTETAANTELAKITQEKLAIEAKSKEQEASCYKKFSVNNCLKDVKTEKLAALNRIKRRELEIKDQLRAKKAGSQQGKNTKSSQSQNTNQTSSDSRDGKSNKNKNVASEKSSKNAKAKKIEKSEAEIIAEKDANAKSRAGAAQKRLAATNEKIAASKKKAQVKAVKNSQTGVNTAKYKQKLLQAEEHKAEVEKSRLDKSSKSKPISAPLPVPTAAELAR